uniref:Fibronectin type-III domain-containing protein n=1 Tax=Salmo trutta TaxID=8032 RepID=A0A674CXF1_SALTR
MAENGAGIGPASSTSRLFKCREPTSAPSAPSLVKVTDSTKSSVTLEWIKPVFDGYIAEAKAKGSDRWIVVGQTKHLKLVIDGLIENTEYDFRIKAINEAGISVPRDALASAWSTSSEFML